jgi:hypothetical protein
MLINSVTLQGYPDGSALVATQFVRPSAWRLSREGEREQVTLPIAEATAAAVGWVPPMPLRDEDLTRVAVPVIESAADPATGGLLYLTRTGRQRGDFSEKVLVRLDRDLHYVGSVLLEQNAVALGYLPIVPDSVIVVDYEQAWYRCAAP